MLNFHLVEMDAERSITIFHDGEAHVATDSHPYWDQIVAGAKANDEGVIDLINIERKVSNEFQRLSERVTVANGEVFFDGDRQDDSLTEQIVRFVEEGLEDWKPLVAFYERVQTNPSKRSRKQLYKWLQNNKFTITDTGMILAYKGVNRSDEEGFAYKSTTSGKEDVLVDNEVQKGYIHQNVGSTVEMARSLVDNNADEGCSVGLHVSNWQYAQSYGRQGGILQVLVDPRDFVSIPKDDNFQKARVCRYVVDKVVTEPVEAAVYYTTNPALDSAYGFVSDDSYDDDDYDSWNDDGGFFYDDDEDSWYGETEPGTEDPEEETQVEDTEVGVSTDEVQADIQDVTTATVYTPKHAEPWWKTLLR